MIELYIQLLCITIITALSCVLPGIFLILRKSALMSDALSHSILFGIVIMFLITQNINSPWIFIGAICTGIATLGITDFLTKHYDVNQDAAIGLTFPFLFSIAILIINQYLNNIHIDADAVLLGELAYAPFDKLYIYDYDCGPKALWNISLILILNLIYIYHSYKDLKLTSFDTKFAQQIGYNTTFIDYMLMIMISITIINAFYITGTILVISFIITPAATAYILSQKLDEMIILSCLITIINVGLGFLLAHISNSSIAGSISTINGFIFMLVMGWLQTQHIKSN